MSEKADRVKMIRRITSLVPSELEKLSTSALEKICSVLDSSVEIGNEKHIQVDDAD